MKHIRQNLFYLYFVEVCLLLLSSHWEGYILNFRRPFSHYLFVAVVGSCLCSPSGCKNGNQAFLFQVLPWEWGFLRLIVFLTARSKGWLAALMWGKCSFLIQTACFASQGPVYSYQMGVGSQSVAMQSVTLVVTDHLLV